MNYKFTKYSTILLMFFVQSLSAQKLDYKGDWQGIITQPHGDYWTDYTLWMHLEADGLGFYKGYSLIQVKGSEYFAEISLSAKEIKNGLAFQEIKILKEKSPKQVYFCIKYGNLFYSKSEEKLKGEWKSNNCGERGILGEIVLFRSQSESEIETEEKIEEITLSDLEKSISEKGNSSVKKITADNIQFYPKKSELKPEAKEYLKEFIPILKKYPNINLKIYGHTDGTISGEKALKLSKARASSVAQFFIEKGILAKRIQYNGFGSSQPIDDNSTSEGRKMNRRVELYFWE